MPRLKPEMWGPLATELGIPWRAAEAMHWQLGEADMARRAGVVPFSLAANAQTMPNQPPPGIPLAIPTPMQYHPGPSAAIPPSSGYSRPVASYVAHPESGSMRARATSISSEMDVGTPPALPAVSLGGSTPTASSQSILPSMAELERGLTSSSEARARGYPPLGR